MYSSKFCIFLDLGKYLPLPASFKIFDIDLNLISSGSDLNNFNDIENKPYSLTDKNFLIDVFSK